MSAQLIYPFPNREIYLRQKQCSNQEKNESTNRCTSSLPPEGKKEGETTQWIMVPWTHERVLSNMFEEWADPWIWSSWSGFPHSKLGWWWCVYLTVPSYSVTLFGSFGFEASFVFVFKASVFAVVVDYFYIALLFVLKRTHCTCMWFYISVYICKVFGCKI